MSDNRTVRVGIVGLGIGMIHVDAFRAVAGCEVVALCDIDPHRLATAAAEKGVAQTFADAAELFSSGEVDAVAICTPNATHAPLSLAAIGRGLHVLVEKPMAMNAVEGRAMLEAARQADRRLAVHFNHRSHSHVQELRRLVDNGDLGELYFGRTIWHRRRGIPAKPSFVQKDRSGGGAMMDLGVHQIDQLLFILGHPRVATLTARTFTQFDHADAPGLEMDVDDFAAAFIRFENGAAAELEVSWASHHHLDEHRVLQVYGSGAGARRELVGYAGGPNELSLYRRRDGGLVDDFYHGLPPTPSVQADFVDAIRHGREPAFSARHGLTATMILDALYESSAGGREVVFAERFAPTVSAG